MKQDDLNN